jgi:zinc protease
MRETGGDWHSMTFPDQTGFFETIPVAALQEVLKLEAARMSAGVVEDLSLRGQRRRTAVAVRAREDSSLNLLDDQVTAVALQRHPYRWPPIGWLPDVERISHQDVARHFQQYFVPNNAVLVLVGDFETRTALGLVEKHFGSIARKPDPRRAEVQEPEPRGERRVRVTYDGTSSYLQFAFQVPELFNDDFYSMLVLNAVLTGANGVNWSEAQSPVAKGSSRLFQALIETGLAVEVRSRISARRAPSLYQLTLTLPDALQFQAAEEAVLEQFERLKNQEVSDVEFARAKNLLVAGEFLTQDSLSKRAFQLGYFESVASHHVLNEFEPKVSRVGKDDLRRVAIRYLGENGRMVGSVVPALKRKTVEVEPLSASSSSGQTPVPASPPPPLIPKELNVPVPSLQRVLTPESIFDLRLPEEGAMKSSISQPRTFAEIASARPVPLQLQRKLLPNGLTLIAARSPGGSTVTIRASVKIDANSANEVPAGLSALVNEMLRGGMSAKRQVPLAAVFDFLGADVSSEIDQSASTTSVRGLSKDYGIFLQLLAEMIQSPVFTLAEFDRARDVLMRRLREFEGEVDWAAEQVLRERIYPAGHAFRQMALGTVDSVETQRLEDVRDFYHRHYRPEQLIISIAGDLAPEEALDAGEKAFGSWKGEAGKARSSTRLIPGQRTSRSLELGAKRTALVLAGLGSLSPVQPDYYPFLILNQILLGNPGGGRLGDRVLAGDTAVYGIHGEATGGDRLLSVRARADLSEVDGAIAMLREEVEKIRDGVTDEEINLAKRSLINAWAVRLGNNDEVARILQQMEALGLGSDYLQRYPGLIESVSRESLLDCARTRFEFPQSAIVVIKPDVRN